MTQIELKFQLSLINGKLMLRFTEIQSSDYIFVCVLMQIIFSLNYVAVNYHKLLFSLDRNWLRDNTDFTKKS